MWWWILVWVLLVLGAVAVLGLLAWRLVRQGIAFFAQLGDSMTTVGDTLSAPHTRYQPAASVLTAPGAAADGSPRTPPAP